MPEIDGKEVAKQTTTKIERARLQKEYIEWLLLAPEQRKAAGLPTSDMAWATAKGVGYRTLRNWKEHPEFQADLEERRLQHMTRVVDGATAMGAPKIHAADGSAEGDFLAIRSKLIAMAAAGDKTALDTYFRTFGKSFVEEENASRKSDFRDWDDGQLVSRVLELVPVDALEAELERRRAGE
jgi:hypothetical protein